MQISRPDEQTVLLSQLDALLSELLRRISPSADPGDNEKARARLFSAPSHDPAESGLTEDWREYVTPELAQLFRSSREVIENDLREMPTASASSDTSLAIPVAHLEQWIHGLNQARLALAAQHDFTEREIDQSLPLTGDPRALALLQVRFYGFLQELFLRELDD